METVTHFSLFSCHGHYYNRSLTGFEISLGASLKNSSSETSSISSSFDLHNRDSYKSHQSFNDLLHPSIVFSLWIIYGLSNRFPSKASKLRLELQWSSLHLVSNSYCTLYRAYYKNKAPDMYKHKIKIIHLLEFKTFCYFFFQMHHFI